MGNIINIDGNVLESGMDVIIHQANCHTTMGAGLARQIKLKYPQAFRADLDFEEAKGLPRLGKFSYAKVGSVIIVNAYGQNYYDTRRIHTNYDALEEALINSISYIKATYPRCTRFAVPKFLGCGLAGGDWQIVQNILESVVKELDINLYICEYNPK